MRTLPAGLLAELQAEIDTKFRLLRMDFSSLDGGVDIFYTDSDVPLVYDGDLYTPRPISIGEVSNTMGQGVDKLTFSLDMSDRDPIMLSFFIGDDPTDVDCFMYIQALDSDRQAIATAQIFAGKIDSYDYSGSILNVTVTSFHALWNKRTMETSTPSCRRNFGESDCGYTIIGSELCDRSYEQCKIYGRTVQFNGFRYLPDLESKEIWWGRRFGSDPS
jgi:hypothetical protein